MSLPVARTVASALAASVVAVASVLSPASAQDSDSGAPASRPPAARSGTSPQARVRPATADDLDFRPGSFVIVTDEASGERFAVFTYVVANKTAKTQRFTPRFELLTGEGLVFVGGSDVPPDASLRVRRAAAGPRALDQFQIMGDVAVGEANAKEGVVIFPAKGDLKDLTLFVSGMSSAIDFVLDPETGEKLKDPETKRDVIVRRTWSRRYSIPGVSDPRQSAEARFDPTRDAWVMR
jgi:hypothetical protein